MLRRQGSLDTFDRLPSRRIDEDFRERGRPPKRTNDEVIADPESLDKEKVEKLKYPRKGKTRMPRELVHTGVIREYGYPYEEEVWGLSRILSLEVLMFPGQRCYYPAGSFRSTD
jgi:hypothetical protein